MFFRQTICHIVLLCVSLGGCLNEINDSDQFKFYTISLNGKTVEQFSIVQLSFQEFVANLAKVYCSSIGLQYYGPINWSTVVINDVESCPKEWLDSELCISVNLSVPLNTSGSYELNMTHLRDMWQTHSAYNLSQLGLQDYGDIPSDSTILILWLCTTGILIIFFFFITILVIKTRCIENYIRQRKDILGSSGRSRASQNHGKKLVPPLFHPEPFQTGNRDEPIIGTTKNDVNESFGIENPGYLPGPILTSSHQISPVVIIDDFDSDDETIYPPSPLSRPAQDHFMNGRIKKIVESHDELETAF